MPWRTTYFEFQDSENTTSIVAIRGTSTMLDVLARRVFVPFSSVYRVFLRRFMRFYGRLQPFSLVFCTSEWLGDLLLSGC